MNDRAEVSAKPERWEVPVLALRIGKVLFFCVTTVMGVFVTIASYVALLELHANNVFTVLLIITACFFLAILTHEMGHAIAARKAGMKVLVFQVWNIQLIAKRHGWRWRFARLRKIGGYVVAFPDPSKSLRSAMVIFGAGGVIANALASGLLAILALALPNPLALLLWPFVYVNAGFAIANLIPAQHAHFHADGVGLWNWWRGQPEDHPRWLFVRLMGRSVFGETAEQLPPGDVDALSAQAPMIGQWLRLKAAQNLWRWDEAAKVGEQFETTMTAQIKKDSSFVSIVRAEIAFSAAIRARNESFMEIGQLDKEARWSSPHLEPRMRALSHVLKGEWEAARFSLQESEKLAEDSPDLALIKSERRLREAIRLLMPG